MTLKPILLFFYFLVWLILAVGSFMLFWRKGPEFKKCYYHKVALFNILVIGIFMLVIAWPYPVGLALVLFGGGIIGFWGFKYVKICASCGLVVQQNPFNPVNICWKCGSNLNS
jgi:hypothetical protein